MDKTVLLLCAVILVVSLYCEMVFCLNKNEASIDNKISQNRESQLPTWLNDHLGRRKRNSVEKVYDSTEEEINDFLDEYDESQYALITLSGNDKFICKNLNGKRNSYTPRLGRSINDLSTANKWLQDSDNGNEYMIQRSPPFAPRLGKRNPFFIPRLGRDI